MIKWSSILLSLHANADCADIRLPSPRRPSPLPVHHSSLQPIGEERLQPCRNPSRSGHRPNSPSVASSLPSPGLLFTFFPGQCIILPVVAMPLLGFSGWTIDDRWCPVRRWGMSFSWNLWPVKIECNNELLTVQMLIQTNLCSYFFPLKTNLGLTWWNGLISIYWEDFPI